MDKVRAERQAIIARLTELRRAAADRDSLDCLTVEKIQTGEYVIQALEMRLTRMQAAVLEAQSLGGFYRLIIEQCTKNPAKDAQRLECLDQQVP